MTFLRKIVLTLIFIGALILVAYLFVWIVIALLVVIPIGYLWLRRRMRKVRDTVKRRKESITIDSKQLH